MNARMWLVVAILGAGACGGDSGKHADSCPGKADCGSTASGGAGGASGASGAGGTSGASMAAGTGGTSSVASAASKDAGPTRDAAIASDASGGSDAGSSTSTVVGTVDAGAATCPQPYATPSFDKSCATADDCFVGFHTADCCGSQLALAFNESEQAAFDAYELECRTPPCPCPTMQPRAEDGSPLAVGASAIAECVAAACLARGADSDCSGNMECADPDNGGACVAATGPLGNAFCRGTDGVCQRCRCASPDTPIATPLGERPIAALQVGDLVYSIDGPSIRIVPIVRVVRVAASHHKVMHVTLSTGRVLDISPGHPTADGRVFADLRPADQLGDVPVVEARLVEYEHAFTHDILPASSTGIYFAAGVPVGSTLF